MRRGACVIPLQRLCGGGGGAAVEIPARCKKKPSVGDLGRPRLRPWHVRGCARRRGAAAGVKINDDTGLCALSRAAAIGPVVVCRVPLLPSHGARVCPAVVPIRTPL